jgi:hypothetical protein
MPNIQFFRAIKRLGGKIRIMAEEPNVIQVQAAGDTDWFKVEPSEPITPEIARELLAEPHDQPSNEIRTKKLERTIIRWVNSPVRIVINGDYECWTRYVIIPRDVINQNIRDARAEGLQYRDIDIFEALPAKALKYIGSYYYGGPGRSFTNGGFVYKKNRRFVVYAQSGGLDI